jgi:P27 family predicted phage terminase small subunit
MKGRKAELTAIDGGLKGAPKAPDCIPKSMVKEWDVITADMAARSILTGSMIGIVITYVLALWAVRESQKEIATHGLLVETAHKTKKPNPACGLLVKANDTVARLAAELGLTPAARAKQGFTQKGKDDEGAPPGMDL